MLQLVKINTIFTCSQRKMQILQAVSAHLRYLNTISDTLNAVSHYLKSLLDILKSRLWFKCVLVPSILRYNNLFRHIYLKFFLKYLEINLMSTFLKRALHISNSDEGEKLLLEPKVGVGVRPSQVQLERKLAWVGQLTLWLHWWVAPGSFHSSGLLMSPPQSRRPYL